MRIQYLSSKEQIADVLTKPLSELQFAALRSGLNKEDIRRHKIAT